MSDETVALMEKAGQPYKPTMGVKEGWKEVCRRCPDLVDNTEKPNGLPLILRTGAVAACLAIGLLTWMVFCDQSTPHTHSQHSTTKQLASALTPSVKVELVRQSGNVAIPTGKKTVTGRALKTLLINAKHQMMMNADTSLCIEPLLANAQLGCLVKLDAGEIYAHVEYYGNPFIVETANGKAVITGTTFSVKAEGNSTTLVVAEGTVRYESEKGIVRVAAGQKSVIVGQSAPSIPLSCNTAELAAWVTGYKAGPALTQPESNSDTFEPPWPSRAAIVLENIDYDYWLREKRHWFSTHFPWIFRLQSALAEEGVEVGYPELLIKTGDVWQFAYIRAIPDRFSVLSLDSLLTTVSGYGFDKQWLLENVFAAKYVPDNLELPKNPLTGLKAFEEWKLCLENAGNTSMELDCDTWWRSLHASTYLAETRALIWFFVRDGKYSLATEERSRVLALLEEEVAAAHKCENILANPYNSDTHRPLCEDKSHGLLDSIIDCIETMYRCEQELSLNADNNQ
ncbi:MAG: FecR domain-containing protein [Planctomycetota bacterium]|jgi:hypothetical protein